LGLISKHQLIANPSFGSGRITLGISNLTCTFGSQSAAVRSDGFQIPNHRQYLLVGSNFMTTLQTSSIIFTQPNIDNVLETLISTDNSIKNLFENYLKEEYKDDEEERLYYLDIAEISRYIIDRLKNGQTENFDKFFDAAENVLNNCDTEIENLIVIGLFEGIQNIGGPEINYYTSFNKWLKPLSKSKWDKLIDFWEGKDWRTNKK
jgi:hypothetical protein